MALSPNRKARARRQKKMRRQLRTSERPWLTVYRSSKHMYVQLVDGASGKTITGLSTRSPEVRKDLTKTRDKDAAKKLGAAIAKRALERNIQAVAFNRNGFLYTGRVKALAEGAREAGLSF